ncbi:hypothetical protein RQN30_01115 [Arcanobacterium hippocoleae]
MLRAILQYHSDIEQVLYAKSGVNKLLADAKPADSKQLASSQVVAGLPKGAFIPQLAQAIAAKKELNSHTVHHMQMSR